MPRSSSSAVVRPLRVVKPSRRVLIVEDELLVAWHLESLSREQNLEVCGLVPDGDGAIEQAADLNADLILMDLRLAGRMDGLEAAQRIRAQRNTPIIFITAHDDAATRERIERALPGAPILAKPITTELFKDAVASVMKG